MLTLWKPAGASHPIPFAPGFVIISGLVSAMALDELTTISLLETISSVVGFTAVLLDLKVWPQARNVPSEFIVTVPVPLVISVSTNPGNSWGFPLLSCCGVPGNTLGNFLRQIFGGKSANYCCNFG